MNLEADAVDKISPMQDRAEPPSSSRRTCWIFLSLLLLACVLCSSAILYNAKLRNDWYLQQFAQNLYDYPLPPQTEAVSRSASVHNYNAIRAECSFIAEVIYRTHLSREEITAYYSDAVPYGERLYPVEEREPWSLVWVQVEFLEETQDGRLLYKVWVADVGYDADLSLDPRCQYSGSENP